MKSLTSRLGLPAAVACIACAAPFGAHADDAGVDAVLAAWEAGFNECSAARIAALYDPAASFWGTTSRVLASTPEAVRFYFEGGCAARPPIRVAIGEHVTHLFGDAATAAGTDTFERGGRSFPARFSFALVRRDDRWLIVQHHSSMMPGSP